jgi:hypothetical protein
MGTITAANIILILNVPSVSFSGAPVQISGFSQDDMFDAEGQDVAEIMMGVDGRLSAGRIFKEVKQNITLQADSPSIVFFEAWNAAELALVDKLSASGSIAYPSLGSQYTLNNGFLMTTSALPDAKKVVQPRKWTLVWETVTPAIL